MACRACAPLPSTGSGRAGGLCEGGGGLSRHRLVGTERSYLPSCEFNCRRHQGSKHSQEGQMTGKQQDSVASTGGDRATRLSPSRSGSALRACIACAGGLTADDLTEAFL